MQARLMLTVLVCLALVLVAGCPAPTAEPEPDPTPPVEAPPADEPATDEPATDEPTPDEADAEEATTVTEGTDTIIKLATDKGDIVCRMFDEEAPISAGNFILLVEDGFYDGNVIHRRDEGFVIQGGCPEGTGFGGPGFGIPLEVSEELKHGRGVLSMARSNHPDSAGSQFFICLSDNPNVRGLDMAYAVFGEVTEGMDVVDSIAIGDVIKKATVVSESPHADAARKAADEARIK